VAPRLASPPAGATAEAVPTFTWGRIKKADHYEFQLAADSSFASIVLGSGRGRGTFKTKNLAATTDKSIPDGDYYWRVRGVSDAGDAGRWSTPRHLTKAWRTAPVLQGQSPLDVVWPVLPLVLRWSSVPKATGYQLVIATDETLSTPAVGTPSKPVETQGTNYALPGTLAPGQYYWAVTPVDAQGHKGVRSAVGQFTWSWPTQTATRVTDLDPDPRVFDPQFSWDPVPGAARYEVEVNAAVDFPANAKWCCDDPTIGTSLSPTSVLANNTYYWRVRAVDVDGNFGQWVNGPSFEKTFDKVTPSIENLRMIDVNGSTIPADPGAGDPAETDTPIVAWDPVPGAASYEVQIGNFTGTWNAGGCSFNLPNQTTITSVPYLTATAPAPLSHIGPDAWPNARDKDFVPAGGARYCIRVRAKSDEDAQGNDVISASFTQLNGANHPAFQFDDPPVVPPSPTTGALHTAASDYILPAGGSANTRTPLFTWNRVADADGYYVVVARDEDFTKIVDLAYTTVPAYAPRNDSTPTDAPIPYRDETTALYWVIIPFKDSHTPQLDDLPETQHSGSLDPPNFNKLSDPPAPLAPINGAPVSTQLEFRWSRVEAARYYTRQVSSHLTFSNLLDDVKTDSTAYTSSRTYPTDTALYWRVRAHDINGTARRWSEEVPSVARFVRQLPPPSLSPDNPSGGEDIPILTWSPVNGAVNYSLHVDKVNGDTVDLKTDASAFTPTVFYGTGIWRWKVRANFPTEGTGTVAGAYTPSTDNVRTLAPPRNAHRDMVGKRFVVSWDPDQAAQSYRAEISQSDAFDSRVETKRTDNTSWAPLMISHAFSDGGTLYWRVAAVDAGGNVGAFKTGSFVLPKGMRISISGSLRRGRTSAVKITVTGGRSHAPIRGARVTITGAGIRTLRAITNRGGRATRLLTPRRRGTLTVTVRRKGFADATKTAKVR
jgi:hypothetical protein